MEDELKKQEEELVKMKTTNEAKVKQVEKMKKENISVKKSLEDVIDELKKELDATKKVGPSMKTTREDVVPKSSGEKAMRVKAL